MQCTPEFSKPLGQALLENEKAKLVIGDVEGGRAIQGIMDRCACRDPNERPEVAEVLCELRRIDVPTALEEVRFGVLGLGVMSTRTLWSWWVLQSQERPVLCHSGVQLWYPVAPKASTC